MTIGIELVDPHGQGVANPESSTVVFTHQAVIAFVVDVVVIPEAGDGDKALDEMVDQFDKHPVVTNRNYETFIIVSNAFAHKTSHQPLHDGPFCIHGRTLTY